jgi:hypothetical protein
MFNHLLRLSLIFAVVLSASFCRADEPFFQMRGVVVNVHDLSTVDWAKLASEHGINTIGTHMFTAEVAAFIQTEKGQEFLANCKKYGIEVEHQLHSMSDLLPRDLFKDDPNLFRMNEKGERVKDSNLCVHSQKALDIVAENAVKYAKILTATNHRYYFWIDDDEPVCACPECAGYSASEQAVIVENRIIGELRKLDPKAQLAHLAYANTISAPKKVKPAEGLFLEFAPIHRALDKPLTDGQARGRNNSRFTLRSGETHAEVLQHLKDNLTVFPAETAVVLEYWLAVSLYSSWKKPAVKLPWHKDVFDSDMATYAELGIRNITTFADFMDDEYFKAYPDTSYLSEYGNGLKNFVPKKKAPPVTQPNTP